jgi:low affinity Fe/Cu permease
MIFAGGGLGGAAGGTAIVCIGVIGIAVAVLIGFGAMKLTRSKHQLVQVIGVLILVLSCALPFVVCSGFSSDPARIQAKKNIEKGMTKEEVVAVVGEPARKEPNEWMYLLDFWGVYYYVVIFDKEGRVESVYWD